MSSSKRPGSRENVRVICRVRPQNSKEVSSGGVPCVKITKQQIDVTSEDGQSTFQFDHVFGQDSSQDEVFECAASPLVGDVLNGYNATIFAYGQTGLIVHFLLILASTDSYYLHRNWKDIYNGGKYS